MGGKFPCFDSEFIRILVVKVIGMDMIFELYKEARQRFPELSIRADGEYVRLWGEFTEEDAYSWFHALANAINHEMNRGADPKASEDVFKHISSALLAGSAETKKCIDVSFVENLFWQIPPVKAEPYWRVLPEELRDLYVRFHGHSPL